MDSGSAARRRDRLRGALLCTCVAGLALAAFRHVVDNGFVDVDDRLLFIDGSSGMQAPPAQVIRWAFTDTASCNWYPVTRLSHALVARGAGLAPRPHHFASLLLHAMNAALLFLLLTVSTGCTWRSLLAASLFAAHPLQTESVAWVPQRSTVLSASFGLLTLLAYVRYARRPSPARLATIAAIFALGLMAKPMLITLPVILLIWDFWPLGRWSNRSEAAPADNLVSTGAATWRLVAEKVPLLALSAAAALIALWTQITCGAVRSIGEVSLGERLLGLPVHYMSYIGKAILPFDLHPFHLRPAGLPGWGPLLGAVPLLAAVSLLAYTLKFRRPWLASGWLWFLVVLLPVSGLVQAGDQSYAERYAYLSIIGLLIMAAWSLPRTSTVSRKLLAASGMALLVAGLATLSIQQSRVWRTTGTLTEHALQSDPDNFIVRAIRSAYFYRTRDFDAAIHELLLTIPRVPALGSPRYNLALTLEARGDFEAALYHLQRAVSLNPGESEYRQRLAEWSARQAAATGDVDSYGERIRLNSADLEAHRELGAALFELGRYEEAAREFQTALALAPGQQEIAALLDRAIRHRPNAEEEAFRMRASARL